MFVTLTLLALLGCPPSTTSPEGAAPTSTKVRGGVSVTAPTYAARAEAAWSAARDVKLTEGAADIVTKVGSSVLVDVPTAVSGLPKGTVTIDLREQSGLKDLLFGTDEKAAAMAVRDAGAKVLIVHSDLRPAMDRDKHVLSRLYHHDGLDWFQLIRVEDGALVYLVVDAPLSLPPEVASTAVAWLRERLSGNDPKPYSAIKPERSEWTLMASLRGQGQELAFSLAQAETLDKALIEVADDLETMHRRQREVLGFPRLREQMPELTIELHRVTERAYVVPRDEQVLEDLWEMGIDGAILLDLPTTEERKAGKRGQSGAWPGSVAATRGITRADAFLKGLAREFRWDSVRPWRDEGVDLQLVRTVHYTEVPGGGVVPLYRGTSPVPMDFVNTDTVRDGILLAGEWYLANLRPDGQVTYKFWPEDNRYSDEYNHVRHTLATWNLWQAWTLDPRPEFLEGAIRAQQWSLRAVHEKDGMAFMTHGGQTKLGSVVVALLGMIEVAKATNDHSNDELMRKFGKFVKFMQAPSGTFHGYWNPETGEYVEQVNDIVPGEAALSLVYLSEYFDDPSYLETLPQFFAYYEPWYRERAVRKREGAPWPRETYDNDTRLQLVQFGPWTVMAAAAYTRVRPEAKDVATFGLEVGRWMIDTYAYTADRAPWPDYVGGYYKFEGELPAMQAFCYAEGTAAAYEMALRMDPAQAPFFEEHTRESLRFALQMQHDGVDSRPYARPMEILGGIKYAMNEPKVRIDYVHHALSAMYQWLMAARKDPNLPAVARPKPEPARAAVMRLWDMPSARPAGLPTWRPGDPMARPGTVVRTSVPASAAGENAGEKSVLQEEDDGAE